MKEGNAQQIVKMINFELSFDGFTSQREGTKRKLRSTNNEILNKILDVRLNNFVNYTQPALARPYSFLYKNKKSKESRKWLKEVKESKKNINKKKFEYIDKNIKPSMKLIIVWHKNIYITSFIFWW